jgi:TolB-like protein/DNA-binding SARP family transcriptional activator
MAHRADRPLIELRVLGPPDLRASDGHELRAILSQPKRLALFAYLAVARPRGFHLRDTLLSLFWPELDQEHARGALRQALRFLRRELGEGVIATRNDEAVRLVERVVRCDVTEFELALDEGDRERAVGSYDDPLLEGFFLRDTPEFERWLETEREWLARRYGQALEMLAEEATARGDTRQAVEWWRQLATVDPYSSHTALGLMSALEAAGDRAAALQLEQRYATRLRDDLDVEPDEAVSALAARLRQEVVPSGAAEPSTTQTGGPRTPIRLGAVARPRVPWRNLSYVGVAAVVVLAVYGVISNNDMRRLPLDVRDDRKAIAVLPFADMSEDPGDDYFSAGVTEDIVARLSKIRDLRVISRAAVMPYADGDKSLAEIGDQLGVSAYLRGSIRRAGDRVRIVAQVVNAQTNENLWAETYDRELADFFDIQADIAQSIATTLQATLSLEERDRIRRKPTASVAALNYVQQGGNLYNRSLGRLGSGARLQLEQAIELADKALALDPDYGFALVLRALAKDTWADRYGVPGSFFDSALVMVDKAMALEPDEPLPHRALAMLSITRGWMRKALDADHRALEADPTYLNALDALELKYEAAGRFDQAAPLTERAVNHRPAYPPNYSALGRVSLYLGDYRTARRWFEYVRDLDPWALAHLDIAELAALEGDFSEARANIQEALSGPEPPSSAFAIAGLIRLSISDYAQAAENLEEALRLLRTDSQTRYVLLYGQSVATNLAFSYWKLGRKEEALELFEQNVSTDHGALESGNEWFLPRYDLARIHAVLGDKEEAYRWLEEAIDAGWRSYYRIGMGSRDPMLENLREDERFQQVVAEVKAEVDSMRVLVEQ